MFRVVAVATLFILACDNPQEPVEPDPGRIAFTSTRTGNAELWVMKGDGSEQTRLTFTDESDLYPVWSPDGTRLAFSRHSAEGVEIVLIQPDGTDPAMLTMEEGDASQPTWAPDGSRIAYQSRLPNEPFVIWVREVDGGAPLRLTDGLRPRWSPDGSRIAFYTPDHRLAVIPAGGGIPDTLTSESVQDPEWSPDGSRLVYDAQGIWSIGADGADPVQITDFNLDREPTWSPDGLRIAYGSRGDIWIIGADGSNPTQWTDSGAAAHPRWSPDGLRIGYVDFPEGPPGLANPEAPADILVGPVDGSSPPIRLTMNQEKNQSPVWAPKT